MNPHVQKRFITTSIKNGKKEVVLGEDLGEKTSKACPLNQVLDAIENVIVSAIGCIGYFEELVADKPSKFTDEAGRRGFIIPVMYKGEKMMLTVFERYQGDSSFWVMQPNDIPTLHGGPYHTTARQVLMACSVLELLQGESSPRRTGMIRS